MPTTDLQQGDCLHLLPALPAQSVDLILTDPPYYKVKGEAWDRQWKTPQAFLGWLDCVVQEFARVLKPNGSLYLFASPGMSARVECLVGEHFNVLNAIRWVKEAGWHNKTEKEALRSFLSPYEEIIFAERFGADSTALGESRYASQCEELRGFVFEPLRVYLAGEFQKARWSGNRLNAICGTASMAGGHYSARSQWCLPTQEHYAKLQAAAPSGVLRREYADLKREYADLKREYEDLRRPFTVTADVHYTDVWTFKTVGAYKGKHPCEKPAALLEHAITASSRPGAVVLDAFMGMGSTGIAAQKLGRRFIGIEKDARYFEIAKKRMQAAR